MSSRPTLSNPQKNQLYPEPKKDQLSYGAIHTYSTARFYDLLVPLEPSLLLEGEIFWKQLDCGDILLNCGTGVERFTKELSPSPWALHLREHKKIFTSCEIPTIPLWLVIWVLHSSIFVFMFLLVVPLLPRTTVVFRLQISHTFSAFLFKENFVLTFFFIPSSIPWHFK